MMKQIKYQLSAKSESIRYKILIPLIIMIVLVLIAIIFCQYKMRGNQIRVNSERHLKETVNAFQTKTEQYDKSLLEHLEEYTGDSNIKSLWNKRDRSGLLAYMQKEYLRLRRHHNVSHFYFIDTDKRVFLRLHMPNYHGDAIKRISLNNAEKTGKHAFGIELGKHGTFALRSVSPVWENGSITGYIELGMEIESIVEEIKNMIGVNICVFVNKKYINRKLWKEGLSVMGGGGQWDKFDDFVAIYHTLGDDFSDMCSNETFNMADTGQFHVFRNPVDNRKLFYGISAEFMDAGNRSVGRIFVIEDITHESNMVKSALGRMVLIIIIAGVLTIMLFNYYVGRIDKGLVENRNKVDQNLRLLQQVIDNEAIVICIKDIEGRYLMINEEYARTYGMDKSFILGRTDHEMFPKSVADSYRENDMKVVEMLSPLRFEETMPLNDGLHTYLSVKFPITDLNGKVYATCTISTDITEREKWEKSILRSEMKYKLLFESSRDAIIMLEFDGSIYSANSAAVEMFGCSNESDLKNIGLLRLSSEYQPGEEPTKDVYERVLSSVKEGGVKYFEWMSKKKDGKEFIASVRISVVKMENKKYFYSVARDITDEKKKESEREFMLEQLIQTEKFISLGELGAGIAHELNTPLNIILGYQEILMKEIGNVPKLREAVEISIEEIDRCRDLITSFLTYATPAKSDDILGLSFSINVILGDTMKLLKKQIIEKIKVNMRIEENIPRVHGSGKQIMQVFINIISNALHAMPDGGTLSISAELKEQVKGDGQKDKLVVNIHNTGEIISKENISRIFDPFFTTKRPRIGTGLGLSICLRIVKTHNGTISVKSEPGEGTTFTIGLPV